MEIFYANTTWKFNVVIREDGVEQDIRGDTVTLTLVSQEDGWSVPTTLTASATISTSVANGVAQFNLSPATTASLDAGIYTAEVLWTRGSEKHIVYRRKWDVQKRLTPAA